MDQKKTLSGLDPQLKATYDRIMSIPTSPTSRQPVQQYIPPAPAQPISVPQAVQPSQPTVQTTQPVQPSPVPPIQQRVVVTQPVQTPIQVRPTYNGKIYATGTPVTHQQKKSSHAFLISSIIAGILLFGIYVLFWLKFFNIPVGY